MNSNIERIFVFEDKRYLIVDMHFEYVQRAESYSGRPSTRPLHSNILLYLRPMGKYKDQALIIQYALKRDISGHIEFLITDNGLENKIMSDLEFANAKIKRIGISSQHPGFEGQDILRVEIKPYIVKFQDEITELPTNPSNPFIARNVPITAPDEFDKKLAQYSITDTNGNTISEYYSGQRIRVYLNTENRIGDTVTLKFTDPDHDFKYKGVFLEKDTLHDLKITSDHMSIELEVLDPRPPKEKNDATPQKPKRTK